jgi:hypothetical protein
MADQDQESRGPSDDALALNKETLQDLDLESIDAAKVKGGIGGTDYCARPGIRMTDVDTGTGTIPGIVNPAGSMGIR